MKTINSNEAKEIILNIDVANNDISYHVSNNARLRLIVITKINNINKILINLEKDANLELIYGSFNRNDQTIIEVYLNGEGSEARIKTLAIGNSSKQDVYVNVHHQAKNSVSDIYSIAIANKKSDIIMQTVATIQKGMNNSNSYQKIVGSILDNESSITGDPVLYIDEFDVIAGHGAAVGKLDDEALFYLMSRGITRSDAKKMLLFSMMTPFLDAISNENLKLEIMEMI